MSIVINYIVESALSLGILTLFYYGFLRNRNIPGFSRWYLLVALVFTSVLPLIHISLVQPEAVTINEPVYYGFMLDMVNIYGTLMQQNVVPAVQQHSGIHWLYLVGLALLMIRLIFALSKIGILQRKTIRQKVHGINVIQSEKIFQPFSFLNTVFVPKAFLQNDDVENIIRHETIHVKQKHTFDLILLELVLLVQWFNPFVWLLRRAIVENHEFIADRAVLKGGISVADYQRSLLYQVMGAKFDLGTGFSYSLTKKRFKMMKTKVNKKGVIASALLSLMLFSGIFFVAASELSVNDIVSPLLSENSEPEVKTPEQSPIQQDDKQPVFQIVEKMPQYPGGAKAMMEFLSENIKYPAEARKNGIQGKVYVNFIIDTKGKVTNVKIVRSVDPDLDAEAVRVVKSMPDWTPGEQRGKKVNVAYMLPINFALDGGQKEVTDGAHVVADEMMVTIVALENEADNVVVHAKVFDAENKPISGANVMLMNSNNRIVRGTITDIDGNFVIQLNDKDKSDLSDKSLIISFVGKNTVKIDFKDNAGGNSNSDKIETVSIIKNNDNFKEITVVGYAPKESDEKEVEFVDVDEKSVDQAVVFQICEQMPQYPGGEAAMNKFLHDNVLYPVEAQKNGIQGRVYVNYIVEKDGSISNVNVKRGVDPSLDAEAVRLIKAMPKWTPGKQRGKVVRVNFMLPISFVLNDDNSKSGIEFDVELEEETKAELAEQDVVFQIVEVMPQYPGGEAAMMKYLRDNIKYPAEAQKNGIQGRVYVNYIVEKDGSISNVNVKRGVDPSLDAEAVRVIKAMPKWTPGKQRGKVVRVNFMLPISFVLNDDKDQKEKAVEREVEFVDVDENPSDKEVTFVDVTDETIKKLKERDDAVFQVVEEMPQYPGGEEAMMKFLSETIKYPVAAQNKKVQGRVYVNYIVEKDGSINNIKVVRSVDPSLDAEAVRVIKAMPKWIPGKQRGKNVRVSFMLPINFVLQ